MDNYDKFLKKLAEDTLIKIAETIGINETEIDGERLMTDREVIEEIKVALFHYKAHVDNEEENRQ